MTPINYDKYKGHTEEYYLQRKHSGFIGNSPVWWAKEGKGYTAYLQNAERFSKETAEFYVNEDPDKWAMFKCFEIDRRLHAIFDMQDFGRLEKEPEKPNPWGGDYIEPNSPLILQRCMELEGLLQLRYELEGVLSDYENDNRIGDIGYNTIKRVAQALSRAEDGE